MRGSRETPCQTNHGHAVQHNAPERAPPSVPSAGPSSDPFVPAVQSPRQMGVFPCSEQGGAPVGEGRERGKFGNDVIWDE